jgi:hypothetical protein
MKWLFVKQVLPFLFFLITVFTATAQKDINVFVGGNLIIGFPSGDFSNAYSYATGVDATLGAGLTEKLYITGTLGYLSYKSEDSNPYGRITLIPLKAGLRIYPYKEFFLAGNAGVGFLKDELMTSRESRFVYDVGMGLHYKAINIGVYYDGWKRKNTSGSSNTLQLRVGLAIK